MKHYDIFYVSATGLARVAVMEQNMPTWFDGAVEHSWVEAFTKATLKGYMMRLLTLGHTVSVKVL